MEGWHIALLSVGVTILTILINMLMKLIDAKTKKEPLHLCPLDRSGFDTMIKDVKGIVLDNRDKLVVIDGNLNAGVDVARRNTNHYEEFVKTLTTLLENSNRQTEMTKEMLSESRKQTIALVKLVKNGH